MKSNPYREQFMSSETTLRHKQIKINRTCAVDRNDAENLVKADGFIKGSLLLARDHTW